MSIVYVVCDNREGYVGIHKEKTRAEHHAIQRRKFFKNNILTVIRAEISLLETVLELNNN